MYLSYNPIKSVYMISSWYDTISLNHIFRQLFENNRSTLSDLMIKCIIKRDKLHVLFGYILFTHKWAEKWHLNFCFTHLGIMCHITNDKNFNYTLFAWQLLHEFRPINFLTGTNFLSLRCVLSGKNMFHCYVNKYKKYRIKLSCFKFY